MKLIDISRKLGHNVPTWPGDTPFSFKINWPMEESGSVNVGKLEMSTHTGTHVDAPFHFDNEGKRMYDLDIHLYVGKALVVDMRNKECIGASDFEEIDLQEVERVLLRTDSWENPLQFPESIPFLRPDLASFLGENGVRLIGVDVPSVDPLDSKELAAHHSLHENGIHILESVDLTNVEPGIYELIALPLPLAEGDGSPVRAVLRML
ncbi:arylformamidase [Bacillus sp. CGMCC 1.16607]|uniref:arylformamidase n=1 Tax=Bacillus sp. CGMCC 1.16607 TaxID=3351842 RepID=UPI00363954BF